MKFKHRSIWRSAIAFVLAFTLVLGMTPAVFATSAADDDTYNYVSLGASQTNGYGMRGYLDE